MIGVTGASGHLGSSIVEMLPDAEPIAHEIPDRRFDAIIHTAAPNFRDDNAVIRFRKFNAALERHIERFHPDAVIITGSWWQHAEGSCRDLLYTRLKHEQIRIFQQAVHVLPYSIYGNEPRSGRGFIPQLILALRDEISLTGLSGEPRDFVHVSDVALAHIRALDAPRGIYAAASHRLISPRDLARAHGLQGKDLDEYPRANPRYLVEDVPGWEPTVDVFEHIATRI